MKGHLYRRGALSAVVALAAVAALAMPALGESDARQPVTARAVDLAAVKVFSGGLDLTPKVRYERAILTVSGVGRTFSLEFDSASAPTLGPFDPAGDLLADGVYSWELQLVPDARTAERLRASAANNGGVPERPWLPKAGSFAIQGGAFATPAAREEGSARERGDAARVGNRREVAPRTFGGQVLGAQKASRSEAIDSDEMVAGGASETGLLKAARGAADRPRGRTAEVVSTQTGPDSDAEAAQLGDSREKVLVVIPKAHELEQQRARPVSDGSNGRKRSDR